MSADQVSEVFNNKKEGKFSSSLSCLLSLSLSLPPSLSLSVICAPSFSVAIYCAGVCPSLSRKRCVKRNNSLCFHKFYVNVKSRFTAYACAWIRTNSPVLCIFAPNMLCR